VIAGPGSAAFFSLGGSRMSMGVSMSRLKARCN
jgi:hypothetical protein